MSKQDTCPICLNPLVNPLALPCGYTACFDCFIMYWTGKRSKCFFFSHYGIFVFEDQKTKQVEIKSKCVYRCEPLYAPGKIGISQVIRDLSNPNQTLTYKRTFNTYLSHKQYDCMADAYLSASGIGYDVSKGILYLELHTDLNNDSYSNERLINLYARGLASTTIYAS